MYLKEGTGREAGKGEDVRVLAGVREGEDTEENGEKLPRKGCRIQYFGVEHCEWLF